MFRHPMNYGVCEEQKKVVNQLMVLANSDLNGAPGTSIVLSCEQNQFL